ncbi:conjugal transfer protein TrbJ [Devosia geojensis]|uniref:Conjugal transfer protein TrbJ n=1 Tax=Devosia geojensis TaxID=443610 RepID=A0A0F5FF29_9HYPH|nr:P-type conjugative transfer protein TrbJ [Devosia geojensis]KKB07160.1 conjugal transfer protein TrbJ [Devosia geojensis]
MPKHFLRSSLASVLIAVSLAAPAQASGALTGATEFTQILNNGELIALGGQNAEQIANQVTQISNQVEQIANQIRIYENMLQNTMQLPDHVWGQAQQDLANLQGIVQQGQGMAFSMGNLDDVLKQRFDSYADFQNGLPNGQDFSSAYQSWSDTNRDTIGGTLAAAGLTAEQFATEESTMAQLRSQSESADGQMKALQVGHQIATQQVEQMQKLRGLVSQQMTMMGTWYQSEQAEKDLAQARRDAFFGSAAPSTSGGQQMQPRW